MENAIRAAGWEQGTLLWDVGDVFLFAPAQPISAEAEAAAEVSSGSSMEIDAAIRDAVEGQLSVLVTHTCDIVKPPTKYPRVEVLGCFVEQDRSRLHQANTNSARYFLINREVGLIADAATRTSIEKAVLLSRRPMNWPSSDIRLKRFRSWLGSRYTRPVDPDEVVEVLNNPIIDRVKNIRKNNVNGFSDVLDLVRSVHVLRKNGSKPYDVTLLFFVEEKNWEESRETIPGLFEDLHEQVSPGDVTLSYEVTTEQRITLSDYLATTYFDLNSYSYEGEDTVGAEPIPEL